MKVGSIHAVANGGHGVDATRRGSVILYDVDILTEGQGDAILITVKNCCQYVNLHGILATVFKGYFQNSDIISRFVRPEVFS